jgi:hypothetical protein
MRVVVIDHVTLDGVMQGPGRPEEDTRDGFTAGGWAARRSDQAQLVDAVGERMGEPGGGMLLGRRATRACSAIGTPRADPSRRD